MALAVYDWRRSEQGLPGWGIALYGSQLFHHIEDWAGCLKGVPGFCRMSGREEGWEEVELCECTEMCPGDSWDEVWGRLCVYHTYIWGPTQHCSTEGAGEVTRDGLLLLPGTEEWWAFWYLRREKEVHFSVKRNPGKSSSLLWNNLFFITSETANILWKLRSPLKFWPHSLWNWLRLSDLAEPSRWCSKLDRPLHPLSLADREHAVLGEEQEPQFFVVCDSWYRDKPNSPQSPSCRCRHKPSWTLCTERKPDLKN